MIAKSRILTCGGGNHLAFGQLSNGNYFVFELGNDICITDADYNEVWNGSEDESRWLAAHLLPIDLTKEEEKQLYKELIATTNDGQIVADLSFIFRTLGV